MVRAAFVKGVRVIQYPVQGLLVLLFIYAAANATEELLRPLDDGRLGGIRHYPIGVPLAYRVVSHYCSGVGPSHFGSFDPVMLGLDIWFFLAVAYLGMLRLPKIGGGPWRSSAPSQSDTLGARRSIVLVIHCVVGLFYLVVGSLYGVGAVAGPFGWWHAAKVRDWYEACGRRPSWLSSTYLGLGTAMGISGVAVYTGAHLPW